MRGVGIGRTVIVILLGIGFVASASTVFAQTHTLNGTVFGGGVGLANTTVEALNDGTTIVAAQTTTTPQGAYSLALADGTYDLRVTPPAGSGFGQETVQNVVMSGADRNVDVVLLSAAGGSISGIIRGRDGLPIANANVSAFNGQSGQFLASATSNASGEYSLVVGTSSIFLNLSGGFPQSPNAPPNWFVQQRNLTVSGTTTLDVYLPVVRVSGVVSGEDGPVVPNASVEMRSFSSTPTASFDASAFATTGAAGAYSGLLFAGSASFTVRPQASSGYTPLSQSNVSLEADLERDFVLPKAVFLSGIVRGRSGLPVANANVSVFANNSGQFIASGTTDANGAYSVGASPGTVFLNVSGGFPQSPNAPANWFVQQRNVAISGATTLDIDLPVVRVSGVVSGQDGPVVPNASVEMRSFSSTPTTSFDASAFATTGATGAYSGLLFAGSASFTVRPQASSGYTPLSQSNVSLEADLERDFVLPKAVFLSGIVRGRSGLPVANANVSVFANNSGQFIASGTTDANGAYSVGASPGTVFLNVSGGFPQSPNAPANWFVQQRNVAITGATTLDIDLPVIWIDGLVTDSNGSGVPNVSIESRSFASTPSSSFDSSAFQSSDAAGRYATLLLAGSGSFVVRPPAQSGFTPASLSGVSLAVDLTQRIILQRPDLAPPDIVAGPIVIHLSDTSVSIGWTTNEPATSRVAYGIGGFTVVTSDHALVTQHLVTLEGLVPTAVYDFRVSSVDGSGNGPVTSPAGTFSTQASPGDITPPVITSGPTVVFTGQTSAIIQWTTDEPASTAAAYGETDSLGSQVSLPGGFRVAHSIALGSLQPDRDYLAAVTSADPDGNSTTSSVIGFRTQAVPDTTAPRITAGPTVADATDTRITIRWTTDEPSTSGVSYNDGIRFFVVSETALVRQHEITLSSLTPQTTYTITVSSTDAVGNGPTLGGPIQAQTETTPDTTAPAIADLVVSDVTQTTAVVSWTTSEPATTTVAFGTASGNLDDVRATLAPVTAHRVVLTGLRDDTAYYFIARSSDAAGNTGETIELAFRTVSAFIDTPPSAPGPVSAPARPTRAESFSISWGASTDDVGVASYDVIRDGAVVATMPGDTTSYTETGADEGSHTYVIRATDTAGHTAVSEPVSVIVDRTAPAITVPADLIVESTSGAGAPASFAATASDVVDGALPVACAPPSGSTFPIGLTPVRCSATDAAGNEAAASFTVEVVDRTAPSIVSVAPSQQLLWPPTHTLVPLTVAVNVRDTADPSPICRVTGVTSNEPVNGLGDGDTDVDWIIDGPLALRLRAERSGGGSGRRYTIAIECRDGSGNASPGSATVIVPHSQGRK